jgi:hypothetical protein
MQTIYDYLIASDVAPTLDMIPGFSTLHFEARPTNPGKQLRKINHTKAPDQPAWYDICPNNLARLYIGTWSHCFVYACPDGTVHKEVFRDNKFWPRGKVMVVDAALSSFKDIPAPLSWDFGVQASLCTPLPANILALVQLYCQLWAQKKGVRESELPVPRLNPLVAALRMLQKAIDLDKSLPEGMRTTGAAVK